MKTIISVFTIIGIFLGASYFIEDRFMSEKEDAIAMEQAEQKSLIAFKAVTDQIKKANEEVDIKFLEWSYDMANRRVFELRSEIKKNPSDPELKALYEEALRDREHIKEKLEKKRQEFLK